MKLLCVDCDEPMALIETRGPDHGSMTVIFGCPVCERRTAMLTNAMETQVVRSLGVKIGGRRVEPEPMEGIRTSLVSGGDERSREASGCPFTGMVEQAYQSNELPWTEGARARVDRIPDFARRIAVRSVEDYARQNGYGEISEAVLDEARGRLGL